MTVPATARRAGPFTGNGITLSFPFAFKVFSAADVQVDLSDATGIEWTAVLNSDYTVALNPDQTTTPGGSVSFAASGVAAPLPAGYKLAVTGKRAYAQTVTLPTGGSYQARSVEDALDSLQMQIQQVQNEVDRSLTLGPLTDAGVSTTIPQPEANKFLGWSEDGTTLQNIDPATAASIVAYGTANADQFTGTGAQMAFTLSANPGALNNLDVSVGGVSQLPGVDYLWASGTLLTFTSAPPAGAAILARYMRALPQGTSDSATVSFLPAGVGATARTAQAKLRERVSILDFGADPTGVALCNTALDAAKAVCNTVYFPPGTYRIENYVLQDLRIIGAGTDGANYGNFTTIIEGSGDIFVGANNFSLEHLTVRNSASGALGKLISVADIDTGIGPIRYCNFLRANYHIYHTSASVTIVGASFVGCLFREARIYSRYYASQGLYQYSEIDCYTGQNKRGMFIQSTSSCLLSASVFEFNDEGAIYVANTATSSDVIRGLKFQNIHFEQNGNITPSPDVTINVSLSRALVEFDSCGFYSSTVAGNVELSGNTQLRVNDHSCANISYNGIASGSVVTSINPKQVGRQNGVYVNGGDIETSGVMIATGGFTTLGAVSTTIFATATLTPVAMASATSAKLVVVSDATTRGAALLLLTNNAVSVINSSLTSVTFTTSGGFLYANTTGGSSFRVLFFSTLST